MQFPAMPWSALGNSIFALQWVSYTLSFEGVLAQWETGNFDQIRPAGALPSQGLHVGAAISWSRKRGEAKQSELVGMTAVAESGVVELSSYLTVVSSS